MQESIPHLCVDQRNADPVISIESPTLTAQCVHFLVERRTAIDWETGYSPEGPCCFLLCNYVCLELVLILFHKWSPALLYFSASLSLMVHSLYLYILDWGAQQDNIWEDFAVMEPFHAPFPTHQGSIIGISNWSNKQRVLWNIIQRSHSMA